jgi:hypothetical protein
MSLKQKLETIEELCNYLADACYVRAEVILPHGIMGGSYISFVGEEIEKLDDGFLIYAGENKMKVQGDFAGAVIHPISDDTANLTVNFVDQYPIYFVVVVDK